MATRWPPIRRPPRFLRPTSLDRDHLDRSSRLAPGPPGTITLSKRRVVEIGPRQRSRRQALGRLSPPPQKKIRPQIIPENSPIPTTRIVYREHPWCGYGPVFATKFRDPNKHGSYRPRTTLTERVHDLVIRDIHHEFVRNVATQTYAG